jgi:hypothetical protein
MALWSSVPAFASDSGPESTVTRPGSKTDGSWLEKIRVQWGGHLKLRGAASWPAEDSIYEAVDTGTYYDGSGEFRLINKLQFSENEYLETHYEAVLSGGDTTRREKALGKIFPVILGGYLRSGRVPEDDRRLMDLTGVIDEGNSHVFYQRLDRLALTFLRPWGTASIGRQAVTWGNGFLFNPMDLINPFAPTDVEREYKLGDDMVFLQIPCGRKAGFQFLGVPRRDPGSGDVEWSESSAGGKVHFASGTTEFDVVLMKNYEDVVAGAGIVGYVRDAAWRADVTWTFPGAEGVDGFLSLVATIDYSWVEWGKNFYGFVEFYFNGLSHDRYTDIFTDRYIAERLLRGDLYALGRTYLSGSVRMELHPLLNLYLTVINNLHDPSGVIQPRATWDFAENFQALFGFNLYYGGKGSEYGGFRIPGTSYFYEPPRSCYLWLSYYF